MDRSWINILDKLSPEYAAGINEFISVASESINSNGMVLCPCRRCMNKQSQSMNVIKLHLITHGFLSTYTRWYHHGEEIEGIQDEVLVDVEDGEPADDLAAGLHDAFGCPYFDIGPTSDFIDNEFLEI